MWSACSSPAAARTSTSRSRSAWPARSCVSARQRPLVPLRSFQCPPPKADAEALGPQDSREFWALFVWSRKEEHGGARDEALPGERVGGKTRAAGDTGVGRPDAGADGRSEVLRPARHVAARIAADLGLRRVGLRRGARLR